MLQYVHILSARQVALRTGLLVVVFAKKITMAGSLWRVTLCSFETPNYGKRAGVATFSRGIWKHFFTVTSFGQIEESEIWGDVNIKTFLCGRDFYLHEFDKAVRGNNNCNLASAFSLWCLCKSKAHNAEFNLAFKLPKISHRQTKNINLN